jgi:hypothetical protein
MSAPRRSARLARLLWVIGLALYRESSAVASELDKQVTFHIESQRLESALLEFSRQADVQFAIASTSIRNVPVRGVDGKLTVEAALLILLRGSGLAYSVVGSTVTVTNAVTTPELQDATTRTPNPRGSKQP